MVSSAHCSLNQKSVITLFPSSPLPPFPQDGDDTGTGSTGSDDGSDGGGVRLPEGPTALNVLKKQKIGGASNKFGAGFGGWEGGGGGSGGGGGGGGGGVAGGAGARKKSLRQLDGIESLEIAARRARSQREQQERARADRVAAALRRAEHEVGRRTGECARCLVCMYTVWCCVVLYVLCV